MVVGFKVKIEVIIRADLRPERGIRLEMKHQIAGSP